MSRHTRYYDDPARVSRWLYALELRRSGLTYKEIAERLGISLSAAAKRVYYAERYIKTRETTLPSRK